jgi:hypothetical protein
LLGTAEVKKIALAFAILVLIVPSLANAQNISYDSPNINGTYFYLEIGSPGNQTAYNQVMLLNFNLQWHWDLMPLAPLVGYYAYSIDGNPLVSIESNQTGNDHYTSAPSENFKYNPSFSYLADTSNLTSGLHKVVIAAQLYWDFETYKELLYNESSSPIFFSVQNQTLSPTPTMPNRDGPTSPPSTTDVYLDLVYWAILLLAVFTVGIVLWLYFRRHQKDNNP